MGLFDDIIASDKGSGAVSTAPKQTIFDDIIQNSGDKKGNNLSPSLQIDKENIGEAAQFGTSVARTIAGAPGALGSVANLWGAAGDKLREKGYLPPIPKDSVFNKKLNDSETVVKYLENNVPGVKEYTDRTPTTAGERVANVLGSFAATPGRNARAFITETAVPAATTAAASEGVHNGTLPAWAAPVAAVGSSVVAKGAAHVAAPPSAAKEMVANAFKGVTPEQLSSAESLITDARNKGVGITWAEALQQVTGGATNGANLQRVTEGMGGMREFMGQRPEQIRQANKAMFDTIAETPSNPSNIGPAVGEAATKTIGETQQAINDTTRPRYAAAEKDVVPSSDMATLNKDQIFKDTLVEIRNDPTLNKTIAHLPDDSPVVLDLVQRRMGEVAENATVPGQASTSNTRSFNIGSSQENVRNVADAASQELKGARATQEVLRDLHLKPLMEGPVGKLANKDITTQNAINALFPQNPLPNSAGEVVDAVTKLSAKNPWAARQVVRAHVEGTFNQAFKELQSGANEFGGASFRSKLIGNEQQAQNLAASISSLPGGKDILKGFDRMMEVMEATGQRQRIGSNTSFNNEMTAALKQGSTVGEVISTGGINLPKRIKQKLEDWNMGKNVDEISTLLTDPSAAEAFKKLVLAGKDENKTVAAINRIYGLSVRVSGQSNRAGKNNGP